MTQQIDCYILLKVRALVKMVFTITLFSTFTTIPTCWRILNIVLFYLETFLSRFEFLQKQWYCRYIFFLINTLFKSYFDSTSLKTRTSTTRVNKKGKIKYFRISFLYIVDLYVNLCQLVTLVPDHLLTLSSRQTVGTNTRTIRAHESAISTIYSVCAVPWKKRDNFGFNANSTNY